MMWGTAQRVGVVQNQTRELQSSTRSKSVVKGREVVCARLQISSSRVAKDDMTRVFREHATLALQHAKDKRAGGAAKVIDV